MTDLPLQPAVRWASYHHSANGELLHALSHVHDPSKGGPLCDIPWRYDELLDDSGRDLLNIGGNGYVDARTPSEVPILCRKCVDLWWEFIPELASLRT